MSIKAVVFDLDDTLYPEIDYVKSGFCEVGKVIEKSFGVQDASKKLIEYFLSDKNDVYGRVLRDCGVLFSDSDIDDLVRIYRTHKPKLAISPEVKEVLLTLRENGLKTGIITDGRPYQQQAKIKSLGLNKLVDSFIITDELGGVEYRKPNPLAFKEICKILNVKPEETVYVGDNPKKDFAVKKFLPIKTIEIKTGIYQSENYLDNIYPDISINTISDLTKIDLQGI